MVRELSHSTFPARIARILIAENDFSIFESLVHTIGDRRLDCDFDVCTTRDHALRKFLGPPYQLIICGAHLTEMDDFFVLKHSQILQRFVPFVVTASAAEKESARQGLMQGAFDLVTVPLEHEQAVSAIRRALWQSRLITLIACKEKALEKYREHMVAYPAGNQMDETFKRTLTAIQEAIFSYRQTLLRVDGLADIATRVQNQARKQALERLNSL
jgi:DNA-binding NtrC family response regulator